MLRLSGVGLALTALLLAAGCGDIRVAPRYQTGGTIATAAATCDRNQAGPGQVVVCRGDTLMEIARAKNVTVANLMAANGLSDDRIQAGSVLRLPDEYVYVVQPGDTLRQVSRQTGVSTADLIAANDLTNPDRLLPETRLAIPRSGTQMATLPPGSTAAAPRPVMTAQPGATVRPASEPPPLYAPQATTRTPPATPSVTIGKPKPTVPEAAAAPTMPVAAPKATAAPAQVAGPQPRLRPAEPVTRPAPAAKPAPAARATKPAKPAAIANPGFILPVEGRILSDFGPKSGGLHNDGINIAAPRGTAIHATADGSVAYAGDGLPGFGNLILVKHTDGWTSAYAHAATMAVKRGDTVRQGQTIGTVGDTGSVSEPQLHFELRQHDRAVDPKTLVR